MLLLAEAEDTSIETSPLVHLPQLDVADNVVDEPQPHGIARNHRGAVARQEGAVVVIVRDERVQRVAVGVDSGVPHRSVLVAERLRLACHLRAALYGGGEAGIRVANVERDVAHAVAVPCQMRGHAIVAAEWG